MRVERPAGLGGHASEPGHDQLAQIPGCGLGVEPQQALMRRRGDRRRLEQQAAVLQHRPAEPPLGAAQDLVAVGAAGGRLHHQVAAGATVEAEQPLVVARRAIAARMPQGRHTSLPQFGGERLVEHVVEHLRVAAPGMAAGHGHRVGEVGAVDDRAATARPPHERQPGDHGRGPGVGQTLEATEGNGRLGPAIDPHQWSVEGHRLRGQHLVGRHVLRPRGGLVPPGDQAARG